MKTNHIFVRVGGEFDGEEWVVYGTDAEATATAEAFVADWAILGVTIGLRKLGTRRSGVLTPCVPVETLPWWAKEQIKKGAA